MVLTKDQAKQLQVSLEKFGLADKPIINDDGTIIGGHQRIKLLTELGYTEVECWEPDRPLTEKEVYEFNIRLNKNTGEWDWDILANQWDLSELIEWGFDRDEFGLGITEEEADKHTEEEKEEEKCPQCGYKL